MTITLNHTIVPSRDKEASARFFAHIFGLEYLGPAGPFAPVRVNESFTLDFDDADSFDIHHYAFHVGDEEFDAIFARIQEEGVAYGSQRSWLRSASSAGCASRNSSSTRTKRPIVFLARGMLRSSLRRRP